MAKKLSMLVSGVLVRAVLVLTLSGLAIWGTSTGLALAAPGQLDPSFGAGGKTRADFGGFDDGKAMALQPDGKIVVAGTSNAGGGDDFAVARLAPQGSLDSSFGAGGTTRADFGGSDAGTAVALQPDGKIVVAGQSDASDPHFDFAVARLLNPSGIFDPSFGSGGSGRSLAPFAPDSVDFGPGSVDFGRAVALQPDGKIVVTGFTSVNVNNNDFAVTRLLNPQGTFDPSFGAGGKTLADFGRRDQAHAVALQPDGKIVVAGYRGGKFAIARLLPGGGLDGSFAGDGKLAVDFGGYGFDSAADAVALQPDGKIVVGGFSGDNFAVARLLPGGGLDRSFAGDGKSAVDFGSFDGGNAVALQPDGKIVLAGTSGGNFAVARLQPNGLLDSTFGNGGKTIVDFGGRNGADVGNAVALQPDGKIVIAGRSSADGNYDFAVARLQGDPGGPVGPSSCAGKPATIVGTNAADRLKGTPKKDVIAALGGKDTVRGLGGNDILCGGAGNDKLIGGPGKDKLIGGPGKDSLKGGPGKDSVKQ